METGVVVRCLCAGIFGFALGLLVRSTGGGTPVVRELTDYNAAHLLMQPSRIVTRFSPKVYAAGHAPRYAPKYAPAMGAPKSSSYRVPAPVPMSMTGLSPEQQAFMKRKMGKPPPMIDDICAQDRDALVCDMEGLSPDQIEFMRRKLQKPTPELDDICHEEQDAMVCDMEGLSPDQVAFMRRKIGVASMDGGLDTHGRPRR